MLEKGFAEMIVMMMAVMVMMVVTVDTMMGVRAVVLESSPRRISTSSLFSGLFPAC